VAIPTASGQVWEDGGATLMARILDNDGSAAQQGDISSISRDVWDLDTSTTSAVDTSAVAVATSIYDTLQTDSRWTEDSTGYNFLDTVAAALLANGNHRYRVEYKFTPASGQVYWAVFSLWVEGVFKS